MATSHSKEVEDVFFDLVQPELLSQTTPPKSRGWDLLGLCTALRPFSPVVVPRALVETSAESKGGICCGNLGFSLLQKARPARRQDVGACSQLKVTKVAVHAPIAHRQENRQDSPQWSLDGIK